ncbi:MAG TPA: DoxX family protein [Puia sp.]|nr:DoxX family protein [Puia sp.]
MKKLLSTTYTNTGFNLATFVLRISLAFNMVYNHGLAKIKNFSEWQHDFYDPLHIGHKSSLIVVIFLEAFVSLFLLLGIFSRIAALLLVLEMCVIAFMYQRGQPLIRYENALLFLSGFLCILFIGPGKLSVDGMTGK